MLKVENFPIQLDRLAPHRFGAVAIIDQTYGASSQRFSVLVWRKKYCPTPPPDVFRIFPGGGRGRFPVSEARERAGISRRNAVGIRLNHHVARADMNRDVRLRERAGGKQPRRQRWMIANEVVVKSFTVAPDQQNSCSLMRRENRFQGGLEPASDPWSVGSEMPQQSGFRCRET